MSDQDALRTELEHYLSELEWQLTEAELHKHTLGAFYIQMEIDMVERRLAALPAT